MALSMPIEQKPVWDPDIRVEWLDQVFSKLPIVEKLIQHECTLWYSSDYIFPEFLTRQGFRGHSTIE